MLPLRTKAEQLMGEDDAEDLVSMARGCDVPIYEHCYLAGLVGRTAPQGDAGADEKARIQSFRETP